MFLNQVMPLFAEYEYYGGPEGIDRENAYIASELLIQQAEIEQERRAFQAHYETNEVVRWEDERELELYGPFNPWGDL